MAVVAATVNQPGPTAAGPFAQELHAFSAEAILTAIFVAVILTVTRSAPSQAILVIPLTLVAIHYVAMHISGASVNPVRSLAPAVVSGTYTSLWVYLTAPFVGSILGWGVYRFLTHPNDEVSVEVDEDEYLDDELRRALDEDDASPERSAGAASRRQAADAPAVSRSRIVPSARRWARPSKSWSGSGSSACSSVAPSRRTYTTG